MGVELARRIGAEIVSMDSMALYRGMDIGTAKPTAAERQAVPHHLSTSSSRTRISAWPSICDAASARWPKSAARGRQVLFVGGTPLYLKGLLRGIFEGPAADWAFAARWNSEARQHGPDWLHRPAGGGRSGRGRPAAPQRHAAADPRVGGL